MHPVLLKVQAFLDQVNRGEAKMPPHVLDQAAKSFRRALERQFNWSPQREFRLRMSNVGMPVCALWHEKHGSPAEPDPPFHRVKMMIGDAVEIIGIAIMEAAGVNIVGRNENAELVVRLDNGSEQVIRGRTDLTVDENGIGRKTYDIKSASGFTFEHKFASPYGYENLHKDDPWGYIAQAFGYDEGTGTPFGGWIAINKESGEWAVLEVPDTARERDKAAALDRIRETVKAVGPPDAEFPGRKFGPEPETFRGKPTGRLILGRTCSYCPYKWSCWPGLSHERQRDSLAKSPKWVYYVPSNAVTNEGSDGA